MEYLPQKCVGPALGAQPKQIESLEDLAAISGITVQEYSRRMFDKLESGKFNDLLKIEAQADLCDWLIKKDLIDKEFAVYFMLSKETVLFCVMKNDFSKDEPTVFVRHAIPGLIFTPPNEVSGLAYFELNLVDIEPRI